MSANLGAVNFWFHADNASMLKCMSQHWPSGQLFVHVMGAEQAHLTLSRIFQNMQ